MEMHGPYKLQKTFNVVTVPPEIRKKLDIESGDLVVWIIDGEDRCLLKKVSMKIE
ncbi:MAG: AbrB/MazE/SpoVT family DNA-binding domain-containing protein [Candidatus Bathyarchaeota archaeon]